MIYKKLVRYFFRPWITVNRFQVNLFTGVLLLIGLIGGSYLTLNHYFVTKVGASSVSPITYDTATNFETGSTSAVLISGTGSSAVVKLSGNETPPTWWNSNYGYRKQITITNNVGTTLISGYSVNFSFDHAALAAAGKSLSSGNDVRIVYWNGLSNTEIDRVIDDNSSWNNAATTVWFKTQASVGITGTDTNYYLYYNYSSAGSPPTNKSNVYALWDDFNDHANSTDPDGWREDSGTWYVQDQYYYTSGGAQPVATSTVFGDSNTDYIMEAKAKYSSGSYVGLMPRHTGSGASDNGYYMGPNGAGNSVEFWKRTAGSWVQQGTGAGFTGFTDSNWHTLKAVMVGSSIDRYPLN